MLLLLESTDRSIVLRKELNKAFELEIFPQIKSIVEKYHEGLIFIWFWRSGVNPIFDIRQSSNLIDQIWYIRVLLNNLQNQNQFKMKYVKTWHNLKNIVCLNLRFHKFIWAKIKQVNICPWYSATNKILSSSLSQFSLNLGL